MSMARHRRLMWVAAFVPIALFVVARAGFIAEADVFWAARAGIGTLDGVPIVHADHQSWIADGKEWTPNSWGWNVVLAVVWKWWGFAGFGVLLIICSTLLFGLLVEQARNVGAGPLSTMVACVLAAVGLSQWLSPRPHLATYLASIAMVMFASRVLEGTSGRQRWTALIAVGLLQAVAINMHLGATSIVVIVIGGCAAWIIGRLRGGFSALWARPLALIGTVTVATLANPLGFGLVSHLVSVRRESIDLVSEWEPGWADPRGVVVLIVACAAAVHAWRSARHWTTGTIAAAGVLAVSAERFEPIALVLTVPEMAAMLTAVKVPHLRLFLWPVGIVFGAVMSSLALPALAHLGEPADSTFSRAAVRALPLSCRSLNDDADGGLIALIRPDVKVSLDGRNDFYGRGIEQQQLDVWRNPVQGEQWLDSNSVDCVIAARTKAGERPLAAALGRDPRWRIVYVDERRTVFVRVAAREFAMPEDGR